MATVQFQFNVVPEDTMKFLSRTLVAGNVVLFGLLLVGATVSPARAQWMTGPSSNWGTCCKTYVGGGRFCCTNCCLGKKYCVSDHDPVCAKPTEAEI